ncbi:MAG: B12-binding domain-containing radical SAM protein [Sedimentisphaerales bacterium]|nr:B12-binding domain-containing radical SAM protein [Sedimentisphaerales bacterium]
MNKKALHPAVVLVADRTLSAAYKTLFEGIFATMQTTKTPEAAMRYFVAPPVGTDSQGRSLTVPLGLRRVEAALRAHTPLGPEEVACTTPEQLGELLGPWTKVVCVSSSDPLGYGMSNTTTTSFWSGELYTRRWMRRMLEQIGRAKRKYGFKVVGGGGGAWQWRQYEDRTARECLDVVFEGYFEEHGPGMVTDLIAGRDTPEHIVEQGTAVDRIRPILGASLLGAVELSRGCGRGCRFCPMADKKMSHIPVDLICADLETNVAHGIRSVVSGSEDFFRYGAEGIRPNFEALRQLLLEMRKVNGLSFMQIDHANISSVAQLTREQLREIRELLTWKNRCDYLWVNMGVESASGRLVAANCRGKISPFDADSWADQVREAAEKMTRAGFYSVFSLVLGLPGETPDDVAATLKLVKDLEKQRAVIFPVFYEPFSDEEIRQGLGFRVEKMRADHLELYRRCYEINFREVPKLFWDNQRAGGVSWTKRAMMRVLGKTEVRAWRKKFVQIAGQIAARETVLNRRVRHVG